MTEFRKFTDQTAYADDPSAKLYKDGKIRINKTAGQLWFDGVEYVEIHVAESGNELGFKPATAATHGTYSYMRDGEHGGHVSVRSVLTHYGIWHEQMDESIALPVRYDADTDMVVVDLSDAVERWGDTYRGDR